MFPALRATRAYRQKVALHSRFTTYPLVARRVGDLEGCPTWVCGAEQPTFITCTIIWANRNLQQFQESCYVSENISASLHLFFLAPLPHLIEIKGSWAGVYKSPPISVSTNQIPDRTHRHQHCALKSRPRSPIVGSPELWPAIGGFPSHVVSLDQV